MKKEVAVTIICLAYNHEKYISKTLESFINQKTNFLYRVIVHDDASTDHTADIIKKYEMEYPDKIKGIYQTENMYSKNISIDAEIILPEIDSTYVAMCEGDDYWIDINKLQEQYNALESDKSCAMSVHRVAEVTENDIENGILYPPQEIDTGRIDSKNFIELCETYTFHTSSYFVRAREWKQYMKNRPEFAKVAKVGDVCHLLYFGQAGSVFYINKIMSHYRRGVPTSWSMQIGNPKNIELYLNHLNQMILTMTKFNEYTNNKYADLINRRSANYYFSICILSKSTHLLQTQPSVRAVLKLLPIKNKMYLYFALMFPTVAQKIYLYRKEKKSKRRF